ncbi:MAG: DUF362 domain-containing protein [Deltaproteobacteria bacterium]|nr:DUF362 domain-containing protein [Deltaproteobacteria bacterium]
MTKKVTLKKGRLTQDLRDALEHCYGSRGIDGRYIDYRWRHWMEDKGIITYVAERDGNVIGRIFYRVGDSTMEEVLVNNEPAGKGMETLMIDALVAKESLVSAEVLNSDGVKYRSLLNYGFRPTRFFSADGFDFVRMDLSIAEYLKKARGWRPAREYAATERVAVEKVAATRTHDDIKASLLGLFEDLGGLDLFVDKGDIVVVKPNVVADHGLRNGVYLGGVVTDIGLLRALIEILLARARKVIVAEGSSINRAETARLFGHYGYDKLEDMAPGRVTLVDLNRDKLVRKVVPAGKRMLSREIPVTLEEADVIINVPVMKTHFAALVSLSIKNLQGVVPPLEKYMSHFFGLWQNLINIHHLVKPKLHIIDGLTAQEGFGPVYGTPKTMNLVIGGTNPVAVDAVTTRIMGFDPALSPPVFMAHMQGLGPIEPEKIITIGAPPEDVMSPFKEAVIDLSDGEHFKVHADTACLGCKGYLHYVLYKLRRPDPANPGKLLIDRPFEKRVNLFLGPLTRAEPNPDETNLFLGTCRQHYADRGKHLPGCPPHAEVLMKGLFSLYPDVKRPTYADESAEEKLERMLEKLLEKDSGKSPDDRRG